MAKAAKKKPGRKRRAAKPAETAPATTETNPLDDGGKAGAILKFVEDHPEAKNQEVAAVVGTSPNYVSLIKSKAGLGRKKKRGPMPGTKRAAKHKASGAGNGHASVIETAAAFVLAAGGLKNAQQTLEQLSIIGRS